MPPAHHIGSVQMNITDPLDSVPPAFKSAALYFLYRQLSSNELQSSKASTSCEQSFHLVAFGPFLASGLVSSPVANQPPYSASIKYFFTYSHKRRPSAVYT